MFRKLKNRARQAVVGRVDINLDGFELGLTLEEVTADLNFGVGPIADTAQLVEEAGPQVGRGRMSRREAVALRTLSRPRRPLVRRGSHLGHAHNDTE